MYNQIATLAFFAVGASAHGHLQTPTTRPLGDAFSSACGAQVYSQVSSDMNGNIQTMAQVGESQSDFSATDCHLWQCRGYQFADATSDSIQSYSAGQTIAMTAVIAAPHTGVANVSVINLAENTVIDNLLSWDVYASTATGVTANETSFSVTMPDTLPDACSTAGGCALQWWWDARSVDQTYMSCVDFTFGSGSSSSSSSGSSSAAASSSTAAPATSSQASTTLATVVATTSSAPAATSSAAENVNAGSSSDDDTSACTKKRAARRAALNARAARNN